MSKSKEEYLKIYEELLGFVPPKINHRVSLGLEVAPDALDAVETMREKVMYPDALDVKTAQMILFACLLTNLAPAAKIHAIAAKRAGATREELHAVAGLAFLFRGLSAFNNGAQIINEVFSGDESIS
ncbi:MAG: carboxymuconolactone decarboxylase family protein [Gammaproteobacteria bacterium]